MASLTASFPDVRQRSRGRDITNVHTQCITAQQAFATRRFAEAAFHRSRAQYTVVCHRFLAAAIPKTMQTPFLGNGA